MYCARISYSHIVLLITIWLFINNQINSFTLLILLAIGKFEIKVIFYVTYKPDIYRQNF